MHAIFSHAAGLPVHTSPDTPAAQRDLPETAAKNFAIAAPLQPATERLPRKRTHAHTTRTPQHTYGAADTAQQTQHSTHSTAQPQMMSTARWGTAPNGGRAVLPPRGWSIRPPPGACGRVAGACQITSQCSLITSSFCSAPSAWHLSAEL